MQIFLPSLPLIQSDLGVSAATAQLVLSLSMVAISFSLLVYGPLSDRFGRRPLLILGLALFLVGSLVGAIAPNIAILVAGRTIQAVGGAAPLVLTPPILRETRVAPNAREGRPGRVSCPADTQTRPERRSRSAPCLATRGAVDGNYAALGFHWARPW